MADLEAVQEKMASLRIERARAVSEPTVKHVHFDLERNSCAVFESPYMLFNQQLPLPQVHTRFEGSGWVFDEEKASFLADPPSPPEEPYVGYFPPAGSEAMRILCEERRIWCRKRRLRRQQQQRLQEQKQQQEQQQKAAASRA